MATNYDRIRNMSIDEMAEIISKNEECERVCAFTKDGKCNAIGTDSSACVEGCKQWLESEVDE